MSRENHDCEMAFAFLPAGRGIDSSFSHSLTNSLGAAYIIAYLRQHGFSAEQVVSKRSLNITDCARIILERKPSVVGLTVYVTNYEASVLLAKAIKRVAPHVLVVFGGPTPSVQANNILQNIEEVDICVHNEGEDICLALLTKLKSADFCLDSNILASIAGISYRNDDRTIITNPDASVFVANRHIKDYLDKFPSPYLSGILPVTNNAGVLTARGCNQSCTYCNCAVLSSRFILTHSVDRVIDELEYISQAGMSPNEEIQIFDDVFTHHF